VPAARPFKFPAFRSIGCYRYGVAGLPLVVLGGRERYLHVGAGETMVIEIIREVDLEHDNWPALAWCVAGLPAGQTLDLAFENERTAAIVLQKVWEKLVDRRFQASKGSDCRWN
jgi:hypothetical protein